MTPANHDVEEDVLSDLAARFLESDARTGATRVLGVDGRSGSGKTTVAARLARLLGAPVVQLEYLYPGWFGLHDGIHLLVSDVLGPLRAGRTATVPSWDWYAMAWAEPAELAPPPVLVVEGVGACAWPVRPYLSLSVWVEVPDDLRLERARARDWTTYEEHWDVWASQEELLLRDDDTPNQVDVVLSNRRTLVSPADGGR